MFCSSWYASAAVLPRAAAHCSDLLDGPRARPRAILSSSLRGQQDPRATAPGCTWLAVRGGRKLPRASTSGGRAVGARGRARWSTRRFGDGRCARSFAASAIPQRGRAPAAARARLRARRLRCHAASAPRSAPPAPLLTRRMVDVAALLLVEEFGDPRRPPHRFAGRTSGADATAATCAHHSASAIPRARRGTRAAASARLAIARAAAKHRSWPPRGAARRDRCRSYYFVEDGREHRRVVRRSAPKELARADRRLGRFAREVPARSCMALPTSGPPVTLQRPRAAPERCARCGTLLGAPRGSAAAWRAAQPRWTRLSRRRADDARTPTMKSTHRRRLGRPTRAAPCAGERPAEPHSSASRSGGEARDRIHRSGVCTHRGRQQHRQREVHARGSSLRASGGGRRGRDGTFSARATWPCTAPLARQSAVRRHRRHGAHGPAVAPSAFDEAAPAPWPRAHHVVGGGATRLSMRDGTPPAPRLHGRRSARTPLSSRACG